MQDKLVLYHGTICDFEQIDVSKGKPYRDFGQGFYLCETFERAYNIALRNKKIETGRHQIVNKAVKPNAFIYEYSIDLREIGHLNVKHWESADREWLNFIIENRMSRDRRHDYDIVIGPTANDDTRTSIRTVMNASNGRILSDTALDLLIEMLNPSILPVQYFFGTDGAVAMLNMVQRHTLQ